LALQALAEIAIVARERIVALVSVLEPRAVGADLIVISRDSAFARNRGLDGERAGAQLLWLEDAAGAGCEADDLAPEFEAGRDVVPYSRR